MIREVNPRSYDVKYFTGIKRVLEIGVGENPCLSLNPVVEGLEQYVVTDIPLENNTRGLGAASFNGWRITGQADKIVKIYADGAELPFRSGAFDAVFARNVLSDPGIPVWTKREIIKEGLRVLDPLKSCLAASALWLIHSNTSWVAEPLMAEWTELPESAGYTVERAHIPRGDHGLDDEFGRKRYPLNLGGLLEGHIFKIAQTPTELS